jgi:hypothetical protein
MNKIAIPVCLTACLLACLPTFGVSLQVATSRNVSGPDTSPTRQIPNQKDPCDEVLEKPDLKPPDRCRAYLARARCILVVRCAPLLSKGLAVDGNWDDELSRAAGLGIAAADAAATAIQEAEKEDKNQDLSSLETQVELLRAFGKLFAALGEDPAKSATKNALLEACDGLAAYLDDSDLGIVESARLWQAVAYRRAGKADRALQILRPALTPPSRARIGFWNRIQRCRALADRGEHAAAISLSLQLSTRVGAWLDDEPPAARRQAVQTIDQLRADLYQGWADRIRKDGKTTQADAASQQADEIRRKYEKLPEQLPLVESIADVPELKSEPNEKTEPSEGKETSSSPSKD